MTVVGGVLSGTVDLSHVGSSRHFRNTTSKGKTSIQAYVEMSVMKLVLALAYILSECEGGRNVGVSQTYGTEKFDMRVKLDNFQGRTMNPRKDQNGFNERVKRESGLPSDKRIVNFQSPDDIDIQIDTSQITVHTADHQLSINLLGRCLANS